ncbi:threonine/serine exporter family protein [Novosphingobium album (ex Liu et al. 2023)]|uniref:Threonine/serine exporter family protein n=1 Tax=Novosphingobium album (ex Liu et al. 2023) TaxID=3031130 RepID=A0ABT5WSK8_9SPHN|nr:threonine/serine exporter family protein [Novosphingobium album (ex Liu et al. 2023)]MDE8653033.1 threonine/serine exporter family protein [Novosphingobium album (ex Liu et al. 2023)]
MIAGLIAAAPHVAHQALFGAIAAVGFGVLFNIGPGNLVRCALLGAVALSVRTMGQNAGWSLEAATFVAALTTACAVYLGGPQRGQAPNALSIAGCIAMVPGAFFINALLGFLSLTSLPPEEASLTIATSLTALLRVIFTLGAMGAGLTIPAQLARHRGF